MTGSKNDYLINIVGALCLAVDDAVSGRTGEAVGFGPSAPAILTTLRFTPDMSVDALAKTLGITIPGTVQLLNRMEGAGLVRRSVGDDRRRRHLSLTRTGEDLAEKVLAIRRDAVAAVVGQLTRAERAQLAPLVERMVESLSGTRAGADRICRLCDERACPDDVCPSELAVPVEQRVRTASP